MKKLIISLTFMIGALMMLDSAQACEYKKSGFVYVYHSGRTANPTNKILYKVGGSEDVLECLQQVTLGH